MKKIDTYKFFEAQDPDEEVVMTVRKHWLYLSRSIIFGLFFIFLLGVIYVILTFSEPTVDFVNRELAVRVILGILFLFTLLFAYISWLTKYLSIFLVTNERLVSISQPAMFVRKISVLEYSSVEDVAVTQKGFLATVLNYGHALIQTAAELLNFSVDYIPEPEKLQDKIMELRDKVVEKQHHSGGLSAKDHQH